LGSGGGLVTVRWGFDHGSLRLRMGYKWVLRMGIIVCFVVHDGFLVAFFVFALTHGGLLSLNPIRLYIMGAKNKGWIFAEIPVNS
jgi:hypothetical protein